MDQDIHNLHAKYDSLKYFDCSNLSHLGLNDNIIWVIRHQPGYDQELAITVTTIRNYEAKELMVVFPDIIRWFLEEYLHMLNIETTWFAVTTLDKPLMKIFTLGIDQKKPYNIEVQSLIPEQSAVRMSIEFEHSILNWHEYSPDSNKGFYIGSALISALISTSHDTSTLGKNNFLYKI